MTRLEELNQRIRRYFYRRLSVGWLRIIQWDYRRRIHSIKVNIAKINAHICDPAPSGRSITELEADRAECKRYLKSLEFRLGEVNIAIWDKCVRSPFYAS